MSVKYLSINSGELTPLEDVKRVSIVTETERLSLSELGPHVDASRFNTKIETSDGQKSFAPETINEITEQGVGLVRVNEGAYVPAENIQKARNLTDNDRDRFSERTGREMSEAYVSQIETKAGTVLAIEPAEQVLDNRSHALSSPAKREVVDMFQARDVAMASAAKTSSVVSSPEKGKTLEPEPDM
ncbi:MAG: hypothetical protein AAFQ24_13035 [Pseudomonadota bacterium]